MNNLNEIPAHINLSVPANMLHFATSSDGDEGSNRTFEITGYTGVEMDTFMGRLIVDLDGLELPPLIPILKQHDDNQIVGHGNDIGRFGNDIKVKGEISGIGAAANEVMQTSDKGFPWQASMGLATIKAQFIDEGEQADVNGGVFEGPGIVVKKSRLNEMSFVPVGADTNTSGVVMSSHDGGTIQLQETEMSTNTDPVAAFIEDHGDTKKTWELAAMETQKATDRERLTQLREAFPDRDSFVIEQFSAGNDLITAKANLSDVVLAENNDLKAKLAAKGNDVNLDGHPDDIDLADGGGTNIDDPAPDSASIEDPEERAKAEWTENFEGCKTAFSSEENYVGLRKRELSGQFKTNLQLASKN